MSKTLNSNEEGIVRIMCPQDPGHFDVKISKNEDRFIDLISNGCFVCKSRLSIEAVSFSKIDRGTKSSIAGVEKTQIRERRRENPRNSKRKPIVITPWERMEGVVALNQEGWRDEYEEEEEDHEEDHDNIMSRRFERSESFAKTQTASFDALRHGRPHF